MAPVYGKARKAALLSVMVSGLGWLIYLIFFCLTLSDKTYRDRISPVFFPHWLFMVMGPLLYLIIIIHLASNDRFHLQSIINGLLALYLLCGGGIIYTDWILYYLEYKYSTKYLFEFGSCTLTVVGVIFYTMFKPYFKKPITIEQMTHIEASNSETKEKQTMETVTVTLPMDDMTTPVNSNPIKENNTAFSHSYVESPTQKTAIPTPVNTTLPRINSSTSPPVTSPVLIPPAPVPIPPVVNKPPINRNNKPAAIVPTTNFSTGDGYTPLIASQKEEIPLYEETRSPTHNDQDEDIYVNDNDQQDIYMNDDDQDIYMNDDENEFTEHNTYEDVSDMKRNQGGYAEVGNMDDTQEEYAELADGPEDQYEELKP